MKAKPSCLERWGQPAASLGQECSDGTWNSAKCTNEEEQIPVSIVTPTATETGTCEGSRPLSRTSVPTLQGITVKSAALLPPDLIKLTESHLRNALPRGASQTKDPSWEVRLGAGPSHNWEECSTSSLQTRHLSRAQWGLWLFLNCPLFLPAPDLV